MMDAILRTALIASASALALGGCVTINNTLPGERAAHVVSAPAPASHVVHAGSTACSCPCDARYMHPLGTYEFDAHDVRTPYYYPTSAESPRVIYVPVPQRSSRTTVERAEATPRSEARDSGPASGRTGTRATVPSSSGGSGAIGSGRSAGGTRGVGAGSTGTRRDPAVAIGTGASAPEPTRRPEPELLPEPTRAPEPTRSSRVGSRAADVSRTLDVIDVVGIAGRVAGGVAAKNPAVTIGTPQTGVVTVQPAKQPSTDTRADVRTTVKPERAVVATPSAARGARGVKSEANVRAADAVDADDEVKETEGDDASSDDEAAVGSRAVEVSASESTE